MHLDSVQMHKFSYSQQLQVEEILRKEKKKLQMKKNQPGFCLWCGASEPSLVSKSIITGSAKRQGHIIVL